jgi:hypothetical protein
VPGSGQPVTDAAGVLSLRFPETSWWTPQELRRLTETSATAATFQLPEPTNPAALAELNQELASRAAVLCAVTALDCYHLLNTWAHTEQLDEAMTAAGVLGDNWPPAVDLPLGSLVDPAYHLMHIARRLLRSGDSDGARDRIRQALAMLSPAGLAGAPDPSQGKSLPDLAAAARAGAGTHHLTLAKEVLDGLSEADPQSRRAAAAIAAPAPSMAASPESDLPNRRSVL